MAQQATKGDGPPTVIVGFECITDRKVRVTSRSLRLAFVLGLASLLGLFIAKLRANHELIVHQGRLSIVNAVVGSFCLGACFTAWAFLTHRLVALWRAEATWSLRRRRGMTFLYLELSLQVVNLVFYLVPNLHVLRYPCRLFGTLVNLSGFIRWTAWNTIVLIFVVSGHNNLPYVDQHGQPIGRPDATIADAPFSIHLPKLFIWAVLEGVLVASLAVMETSRDLSASRAFCDLRHLVDDGVVAGDDLGGACQVKGSLVALTAAQVVLTMGCYCLYLYWIRKAFMVLRERPYHQYRVANNGVRHQLRSRVLVGVFMMVSVVLLWFVRIRSCSSYVVSWLGFMPMQIMMSALVVLNTYLAMPTTSDSLPAIAHAQLQHMVWREEERGPELQQRRGGLLEGEPVFCFETALKAFYWSNLLYDYLLVEESPWDLGAAMGMWGLQQYALLEEPQQDTRVLLAWGPSAVVLAFRGTASLTNVAADMQVWRVPHPPTRGSLLLQQRPLVHRGFMQTFVAGGLDKALLQRVRGILEEQRAPGAPLPRIILTGHSLGGALAVLAAHELQRELRLPSERLSVYTFGAPRTGNHAYAAEYAAAVPDTWHTINNQDVVARGGKFVALYKRPGHRVLLTSEGDLIVRPAASELSLRQGTSSASLADHLLSSYQQSLLAVVEGQDGRKDIEGGREGVLLLRDLLHACGLLRTLKASGSSSNLLQRLQTKISSLRTSFKDEDAAAAKDDAVAAAEGAGWCGDKRLPGLSQVTAIAQSMWLRFKEAELLTPDMLLCTGRQHRHAGESVRMQRLGVARNGRRMCPVQTLCCEKGKGMGLRCVLEGTLRSVRLRTPPRLVKRLASAASADPDSEAAGGTAGDDPEPAGPPAAPPPPAAAGGSEQDAAGLPADPEQGGSAAPLDAGGAATGEKTAEAGSQDGSSPGRSAGSSSSSSTAALRANGHQQQVPLAGDVQLAVVVVGYGQPGAEC